MSENYWIDSGVQYGEEYHNVMRGEPGRSAFLKSFGNKTTAERYVLRLKEKDTPQPGEVTIESLQARIKDLEDYITKIGGVI